MKKLLAGLLAIIFVLSLTACDGEAPSKNNPTTSTPSAVQPTDNPTAQEPSVSAPAPEVSTPVTSADSNNSADAESITKNQAKQIALDHAKLTAEDIKHFEIELDRNGKGLVLYDIEFTSGTDHYDYDIKALDGTILSAEKNDKSLLAETYKKIAEAEAKAIALKHAGLKDSDTTNYKIEFDVDDGTPSYEIEFVAGGFEYEYDIHSSDGKIIKSEKEIAD